MASACSERAGARWLAAAGRPVELETKKLPFEREVHFDVELLWPAATDDDDACRFLRDAILRIAKEPA